MMNLDTAAGRLPLVLLVDAAVSSRHTLWRALHRGFAVLEADSVDSAQTWMGRRPDIDALVVHGDLADGRAEDLASTWLADLVPGARRAVVLASDAESASIENGDRAGVTRVELGDLRGVVEGLARWLSGRDAGLARQLLRDADRLLV
jgi:hypothetical protein